MEVEPSLTTDAPVVHSVPFWEITCKPTPFHSSILLYRLPLIDFGVRPSLRLFPLYFIFLPFVYAQSPAVSASVARSDDTGLRRFELGGQVADIRAGCSTSTVCLYPQFGLGIGGALTINQHFALDANWNITPGVSQRESGVAGGRANEFIFGVRGELRAKHYGYFLVAKPGFINWNYVVKQISPTPPYTTTFGGHTSFVSDVGAGLEYSPGGRIHVRVELSDLVTHYAGQSWGNNLQSSAGIYVGLGNPVVWTPPRYDARTTHRFFDAQNVLLIAGSVLGTTADAITTQQFIQRGSIEGDPFARPLVKYGWSGQATASGLEIGAEILGMYGLHRIGQHFVERLLPACIATAHGIFAYQNANISYSKTTN